MKVFDQMTGYGHEKLLFAKDETTGLKTIIAIHDTTLGPALGGTRFWNYDSEDDALYDALRLSKGMTLKNAAAGLKMGGGKAVIIGDPQKLKSAELFHAYGRIINTLGGHYYTAEDVNINTTDVGHIKAATPYVTEQQQLAATVAVYRKGNVQGHESWSKGEIRLRQPRRQSGCRARLGQRWLCLMPVPAGRRGHSEGF